MATLKSIRRAAITRLYRRPALRSEIAQALRVAKSLLDDVGGRDALSQSGKDKYVFVCSIVARS